MSSAPGQANPRFVPWILYGAMWVTTFIYLFILAMQQPQLAELPGPDLGMVIGLALAGVGSAVASLFFPPFMHRKGLSRVELEIEEVPDPNASVMFRDQTPTIRVFADPEAARGKARALFFTPFILRHALAESVAIYGVVLGFLGAGWETILPFFCVCWAIFAISAPLDARIHGPLEEAQDARFPEDAG